MLHRLLKAIIHKTIGWERFWKYRHLWDPKWPEGYKNLNHPHRRLLAYKVLEHAPKRILEVGCGAGANLRLIHGLSPDLWTLQGIDISPKAVREAIKWNVKAFVGSFEDIPYEYNYFDVAFTDTSFMYAKDKVKALKELKRVAKKVILYEWETLVEVIE